MMDKMTSRNGRRAFPPPVGTIPFLAAIAATLALAIYGVSPRFRTETVGVVSQGNGTQANQPLAQSGGNGNTGPSQGGGGGGGGGGTTKYSGSTGNQQASQHGTKCAGGQNGGQTAPGVDATSIHVASTIVTTGVGSGFLGEAVNGMQAAIKEANDAGGVCGRRIVLDTLNSGWSRDQGSQDISGFINSGKYFALVAEPDSEGLEGAIESGTIDRDQMPVVGTDGMLKSQYNDPWVWPVAASTVTNMHIIAKYAVDHFSQNGHAPTVGIVYDQRYKFGPEGASALDAELYRLTGNHIPGHDQGGCSHQFCGISSDQEQGGYADQITAFDSACSPCDVVVMLLEPHPMETWMNGEANCGCTWSRHLFGGEPLFDDSFASSCAGECANMTVWTGYHPSIQPFDSEKPVYTYVHSLQAQCPSCDAHNEFTEGAYLGTKLFIEACRQVGPDLTRQALKQALDTKTFDFGLSVPLTYGAGLPHLANVQMAGFSDNASGSFNNWSYLGTGFLKDPDAGRDLQ